VFFGSDNKSGVDLTIACRCSDVRVGLRGMRHAPIREGRSCEEAHELLGWLGAIFIVAWLVLWLAVKVSFAAIHVLVAIGLLLLIVAFARRFSTRKT
jgi:Flp pilus assembly protein TadB